MHNLIGRIKILNASRCPKENILGFMYANELKIYVKES